MSDTYFTIGLLYHVILFEQRSKKYVYSIEIASSIFARIPINFEVSEEQINVFLPYLNQTKSFSGVEAVVSSSKMFPLSSVFNYINRQEGEPIPKKLFRLPTFLALEEESIMPIPIVHEDAYLKVWYDFEADFIHLPGGNISTYNTTLLALLKKYTSLVPAQNEENCFVAYYDAIKTHIAFALSKFIADQVETTKKKNFPYLLYAGDVSGIQNFIYNTTSKQASKSLKGRSFFLQVLVDSIIRHLLGELSLPMTHVVYASGGRYYLLLPNTDEVQNNIKKFHQRLEKFLWEKYKGSLYLAHGTLAFCFPDPNTASEVCISDEQGGQKVIPFYQLWKQVSDKASEKKTTRFKNLITDEIYFERLFNPSNHAGSLKIDTESQLAVCKVTGTIIEKHGEGLSAGVLLDNTEDIWVHEDVKLQIDIAEPLRFAEYLILSKTPISNLPERKSISFDPTKGLELDKSVPIYYTLAQQEDLSNAILEKELTLLRVNNTDLFQKEDRESLLEHSETTAYDYFLYGGNKQALVKDKTNSKEKLAEFTDLARHDNNESTEGSKIAILRMDIDNMGQVFIKGLPVEDRTFAAYSTLSSQLDLFFSGYLNTIRNSDDFKDKVNIVYSGGDDVFAVGRWEVSINRTLL